MTESTRPSLAFSFESGCESSHSVECDGSLESEPNPQSLNKRPEEALNCSQTLTGTDFLHPLVRLKVFETNMRPIDTVPDLLLCSELKFPKVQMEAGRGCGV